jgi:hypothetical protein
VESGLFHTSWYPSLLEPDSTTGALEQLLRNEARRPKRDYNQVLAVGHSRMALLPRIANDMHTGYQFASISLGGTTPRV